MSSGARTSEEVLRILRPRQPANYFREDDSDDEVDAVVDHDSEESEYDVSDLEGEEPNDEEVVVEEEEAGPSGRRRKKYVYGKDKYKWSINTPETRGRRLSETIILPTAKNASVSAHTPYEFWNALFTDEILEIILKHTNEEVAKFLPDVIDEDRDSHQRSVTMNELKAFLGILYLLGAGKNNHVSIKELWGREFGISLCKAAMSKERFHFISCRIRFDDKTTRAERRAIDNLAPVREIWDIFIKNCELNYSPSECLTIGEQLLGFRGKFSARVYIKSKPARYGIKIVSMNDVKNGYMLTALPYIGRVPNQRGESVPSYYIRVLIEPIHHTNRNITCDNWFSSIEIFTTMKNKYGLTMVGTLRKNKRQIPESFRRNAAMGTTRYGYDGKNILLSFCPKQNKVVLLLSSKHKSGKQCENENKPEIVDFYNRTKCGTDIFDQMCANYSCARITQRWTMRFFLGMLDQASVNSSILYNFVPTNESLSRCQFLKNLALSLITPQLYDRLRMPGLQKTVTQNIRYVLNIDEEAIVDLAPQKMSKQKRCYFCPTEKDRKTNYCCAKCAKPTCDEHRIVFCTDCSNK